MLIDHPHETATAASAFWSATLGSEQAAGAPPPDDPYTRLQVLPGGLLLEFQRTGAGTPPRIHLDIETDDVAAEVARVIALGARVVEQRTGYVILQDPGGLPFCVVPVQTGGAFERGATTWP